MSNETKMQPADTALELTLRTAGLAKLAPFIDQAGIELTEELLSYRYATLAAELRKHADVELTDAQERKLRKLLNDDPVSQASIPGSSAEAAV